jgi:hypothetical protein
MSLFVKINKKLPFSYFFLQKQCKYFCFVICFAKKYIFARIVMCCQYNISFNVSFQDIFCILCELNEKSTSYLIKVLCSIGVIPLKCENGLTQKRESRFLQKFWNGVSRNCENGFLRKCKNGFPQNAKTKILCFNPRI